VAAQLVCGAPHQVGSLSDLALHDAQLLTCAVCPTIQNEIQIKDAGFNITQRLTEVVDQSSEDVFGRNR
jgi:hypothetical protein